ncbi:PrsW family intramembrane metalloprotease [Candidatus Parcubacteria bacterium]|nr:MAG: PrsW family intramembrane metalloprotease [Candidatus Parcubacteria bacterium]
MNSEFLSLLGATAGGVFPALAWLWFWLREDARHPEPRRVIALAFLVGMVTVALVIPLQKFAQVFITSTALIFVVWSIIEEVLKFLTARFTVLRSKQNDEPIDPVIYMVTVALGFAAAENALFLLSPLAGEGFIATFQTGNLRFIGAMLLHVLSSAVIGAAIGLAFYKSKRLKRIYTFAGVILACLLHSAFNFLILNTAEGELLRTFGMVWIGLIGLLAVLEYIKRIHPRIGWRS